MRKLGCYLVLLFISIAILYSQALSAQVTLAWDPNSESDLAGYKLYRGTTSGSYGVPVSVGKVTTYTDNTLEPGVTYYFALTAFDTEGFESGFSNEVSYQSADSHSIIAVAGIGGSISPSGTTQVSHNGSQTYVMVSQPGYRISNVQVDGVFQGAVDSFTFSNVVTPHSISVNFEIIPVSVKSTIGVFSNGVWRFDLNGNGVWDGTPTDGEYPNFITGVAGAIPVTGDWNGDGTKKIGIYANGVWYLDWNGNGVWDGPNVDKQYDSFTVSGITSPTPVVGDWTGSGTTKIGLFSGGKWYLDWNGNGLWDGSTVDKYYASFGTTAGDIPVTGDWTGTGITRIGVFRNTGNWYLDINGSGVFETTTTDKQYAFTYVSGDKPVVGDWSGIGKDCIGVVRGGTAWYLDLTCNGVWNGVTTDRQYPSFQSGLTSPVAITK
jgi:hypothetical protein